MDFRRNNRGIDEALQGAEMRRHLNNAADTVADEIRRNAPRGFMSYEEGIGTEDARPGPSGDLESAVVVDSPGWHLVEYGSVNTAPRAIIRNAVRSAGLDFEEGF